MLPNNKQSFTSYYFCRVYKVEVYGETSCIFWSKVIHNAIHSHAKFGNMNWQVKSFFLLKTLEVSRNGSWDQITWITSRMTFSCWGTSIWCILDTARKSFDSTRSSQHHINLTCTSSNLRKTFGRIVWWSGTYSQGQGNKKRECLSSLACISPGTTFIHRL